MSEINIPPRSNIEARLQSGSRPLRYETTVGIVVDTNDPQQMGRVRAVCTSWGDTLDLKLEDIPWAQYVAPFGGTMQVGARGPEDVVSKGPVAYGMFAIPKVNSQVIVSCIDGNPSQRIWMGCLFTDGTPHTMPHGRFLDGGKTGPLTTTENPIEPMSTNAKAAFGAGGPDSFEWQTRIADNQVAAIDSQRLDRLPSDRADDKSSTRRGYQTSRISPQYKFPNTGGNFDPQTYTITTPGMHSLTMDDSKEYGRIRLRSTSGNQIILDDTNERIYVSTPDGNNWVEMDRNGNIDIFSERRISVHASKDINFTADETFRVTAKNIHLNSSQDVRITSNNDTHLKIGNALIVQATNNISVESTGSTLDIKTQGNINIESAANVNLCGDTTKITGQTDLHLKAVNDFVASGNRITMNSATDVSFGLITEDAPAIGAVIDVFNVRIVNTGTIPSPNYQILLRSNLLNIVVVGPSGALIPSDADDACGNVSIGNVKYAYAANRVPNHEAWGRIMVDPSVSDNDFTFNNSSTLELTYLDPNVGRVELGENISRNAFWRR